MIGIENVNEFYTHHYLAAILSGDVRPHLERWRRAAGEGGASPPWRRLARLQRELFRHKERMERGRLGEARVRDHLEMTAGLLDALGYGLRPLHRDLPAGPLPLLGAYQRADGEPLLWLLPAAAGHRAEEGVLARALLAEQHAVVGKPAPDFEAGAIHRQGVEALVSDAFQLKDPPRFVLILGDLEWLLADRGKWPEQRLLRFDLEEGRISYATLGINQLGAVYEALLSFRGFFAEETLYEVKSAKVEKPDPIKDAAFFVPEADLHRYRQRERLFDQQGRVKSYPPGSFIYRMAGRDRQKSASYYTPEVLTRCLVKYALKELLEDEHGEPRLARAEDLLELTICEPAMGSAAFLNEAINQLSERYLQRRQQELGERIAHDRYAHELQRVRMYLADNNVYGVDLNPVAVELAEVSLWLNAIFTRESRTASRSGRSGRPGDPETGRGDEPEHALSCPCRKEGAKQQIESCLYLYRTFASEALRLLLPMTDLGTSGQLNSFVAALQAGLKERFGGRVDHLRTTVYSDPVAGSTLRKQYLVIFDSVPGGTGYLKELLTPPTPGGGMPLFEAMEMALRRIEGCRCWNDPDRDGCYRCLYAYRNARDMGDTSAQVASDLLRRILAKRGQLQKIASLKAVLLRCGLARGRKWRHHPGRRGDTAGRGRRAVRWRARPGAEAPGSARGTTAPDSGATDHGGARGDTPEPAARGVRGALLARRR